MGEISAPPLHSFLLLVFFFFFLNVSYHFCQGPGALGVAGAGRERYQAAQPTQSDHIVPVLFFILRIPSKAQSCDICTSVSGNLTVCVCVRARVSLRVCLCVHLCVCVPA